MKGNMLQHLVYLKLSEGSMTGYDLCKSIDDSVGHRPSYGSIYPMLDRMKDLDHVECEREGRKKLYSLTAEGKARLDELRRERTHLIEDAKVKFKALFEVTGQDPSPMISVLERLEEGKSPLGKITANMIGVRDLVFEMASDGRAERNSKEINRLLKKLEIELRRMR